MHSLIYRNYPFYFSHSDLEADDEEFDSLNQSDSVNQSDHGNHEPQTSVNAGNKPRLATPTGDNSREVKNILFYYNTSLRSEENKSQLNCMSISIKCQLIERAQEENRKLLSLLEDRDIQIMALEARVLLQQHEAAIELERLREENAALIRAMASLGE